jgi:hypothetical protein
VSSHDTWCSSVLTNIGMRMFNNVVRCMLMLMGYMLTNVYTNDTWH